MDVAGMYAFWWLGSLKELEGLHRAVSYKGKVVSKKDLKKDPSIAFDYYIHSVCWDWNLDSFPVCLYVGKANSIKQRFDQHLELRQPSQIWYNKEYSLGRKGEMKFFSPDINSHTLVKRTSGCQFRAGVEHLFKNKGMSFHDELGKFGVSFFSEPDFIQRFYMEDLAIGYYRPWFNLDCER